MASICQAVGCTAEIGRGKFMCRSHWFGLPAPLRQQVNACWRSYIMRDRSTERLIDHAEACDEAIRLNGRTRGQGASLSGRSTRSEAQACPRIEVGAGVMRRARLMPHQLPKAFFDTLVTMGLPESCRKFVLRAEVGKPVEIECYFYPTLADGLPMLVGDALLTRMKMFRIVEATSEDVAL